jgi:hypothetical protein
MLDKLKSIFLKNDLLTIDINLTINVYSNLDVDIKLTDSMLSDIKKLATDKLLKSKRKLARANVEKYVRVSFNKSIPIGITIPTSHLFYWDGDTLYSCIQDYSVVSRILKLDQIL